MLDIFLNVQHLIATGNLMPLMMAAGLFLFVGRQAVKLCPDIGSWGWLFALLAFLAYVGFAYMQGFADAEAIADAALRAIISGAFALSLAWIGLAFVATAVVHLLIPALRSIRASWQRTQQRLAKEAAERRAAQDAANVPPPPEPVPPDELLQRTVDDAHHQHETEIAAIRSAGLDDEEQAALETHATQRMLRRLKEILDR